MNPFTTLKKEIVSDLQERLKGISVTPDYPDAPRQKPLKRPLLAVGISGVELVGAGQARLTLRFDILCPAGQSCHDVFEQLCGALAAGGASYGEISCGELSPEQNLLHLTARATLSGILHADIDEHGETLQEIIIQTKGV